MIFGMSFFVRGKDGEYRFYFDCVFDLGVGFVYFDVV